MLDECPCCKRVFKRLEDYPIIYLHKFERAEIPIDSIFPFEDFESFIASNTSLGNKIAPQEVINFFNHELNAEKFWYQDWEWKIERIEGDRHNIYRRTNPNQKDIIITKINPYLNKLESLVGKEVILKEILPDFDKNNYFKFSFDIPDTDYCLALNEEKYSNDFRISKIEILGEGINLGSGGGPTLTNLCEVGKLTYKGKVKFNHFNSF